MIKKVIYIFLSFLIISCGTRLPKELRAPKTEFRGVWIATVVNIDWPISGKQDIEDKKEGYLRLLDFYKELNFNAAIVQIRTAGDAFYPSKYAPWSRYLTGTEGEASEKYDTLLQWMIKETHDRGMEFHAWLNPYRATFDLNTEILSETHDFNLHPEWMIKYGKKYYYNPGLPEVQTHLLNIINEVVENYKVDAIHFDDYFYPYKIKDEEFDDLEAFEKYRKQDITVDDWRRDNINTLVKSIHESIKLRKPWVQFGISPFGVWRNASTDPRGSDSKAGQTTYDDLYADPLTWIENGWIDYIAPQLYWSLYYPPASHSKLMDWWSVNAQNTQLYIGNGAYKIRNNADKAWKKKKEIPNQLTLARETNEVDGNIFFSAKSLIQKNTDVANYLRRKYYKYPALTPVIKNNEVLPEAPQLKSITHTKDTYLLVLDSVSPETPYLILYGFKSAGKIDMTTGKNILEKVYLDGKTNLILKDGIFKGHKIYAISFLDRFGRESQPFLFTFNPTENGNLSIKKYQP